MKKRIKLPFVILVVSILVSVFSSCHHPKKVNTSFYYWKTVYKTNPTESAWLRLVNQIIRTIKQSETTLILQD
jgi:hypothetical protein